MTNLTQASPRYIARREFSSLAGLVAPPLFVLGVALSTALQWHYLQDLGFSLSDHGDSAWPSGLAQGPYGWTQVANYALLGMLIIVFARGLRLEFERTRSRRVATGFLTLLGIGFLFAAFPEDGPPFGEPTTLVGHLHGIGFLSVILGSFGGMLATGVALRRNVRWPSYPRVCVVAALAAFVFLFVLVFALEIATTLGIYGFFGTLLVWIELMALRLWRLTTQ